MALPDACPRDFFLVQEIGLLRRFVETPGASALDAAALST
jgi:hypothetical protein